MRIDLNQINQEDLQIIPGEVWGGEKVILIRPTLKKHTWLPHEMHLRSVMCNPDGEILSSGFPKFLNYGENAELDLVTRKAIAGGKVYFAEKMDGSLIIRSVISGRVHLRTRGANSLGEFHDAVMDLINEKYPTLLDPSLDSGYSLLFEYTSPENKIIISYPEPGFTALGKMDLSTEPPEFVSSPQVVAEMEQVYKTPAVKFYELGQNIQEVTEQVKVWQDKEGVVAWCRLPSGQMHLSKIKAAEYVRLHSLKFHFSKNKVKKFCYIRGITTLEQLQKEMYDLGVDWEGVEFIQEYFNEYIEQVRAVHQKVEDYLMEVRQRGVSEMKSRKEQVAALKEIQPDQKGMFTIGIQYLFGTPEKMQRAVDALILEISMVGIDNYRIEAEGLVQFLVERVEQITGGRNG